MNPTSPTLRRAALVTAVLVGLGTPGLAIGATTHHETVLVGSGQSTQRDRLAALAGSSRWLVYVRSATYTSTLEDNDTGDTESAAPDVIVRSKSGSSRVLSVPSALRTNLGGWSISGNWLVAEEFGSATATKTAVLWWNVKSRRHGMLTLPGNDSLLTAAPGGATYMTKRGVVKVAKTAGGTTILGRPFAAEPPDYYENTEVDGTSFTAANDQGIVLGGESGQVRYLAFDHPGAVHNLASGANEMMLCSAVSHRFAACPAANQNGGDIPQVDTENLIPLDGGNPTSYADGLAESEAISGDRLVWASYYLSAPDGSPQLRSLVAGATAPVDGTTNVTGVTTAFGEAIADTPSASELLAATDATTVSTLVTAPKTPPTVSAFSLAAGRIVDIDDSAPSSTDVAVRSRSIGVTATKVSAGPPTVIARPHPPGLLNVGRVAASPEYTAYETVADGDAGLTLTLHVASDHGETSIGPTVPEGGFALSGHRLLFVRQAPGKHYDQLVVRNLLSGNDTVVVERFDNVNSSEAISGHFVSFITGHGGVFRYDLSSGHTVRIAKRTAVGFGEGAEVFEQAGHVGWTYEWTANDTSHTASYLRNRPASKIVALDGLLIGLSSRGALLARTNQTSDLATYGLAGVRASIALHDGSGHTVTLLSKRRFVAAPQLVGETMAWGAANGSLRVTQIG